MQGVEIAHCHATIKAVLSAAEALWHCSVEEVLRPMLRYDGKPDTLGMDAIPEITIMEILRAYDNYCVVITEETGTSEKKRFSPSKDPSQFHTVYICDPTDRSSPFKKLLSEIEKRNVSVGEVVREPSFRKRWEEINGAPVEITGATSAVTCVRRGVPIFAVIVNYVTRQLFVSCGAGNYALNLPDDVSGISLDDVVKQGEKIFFRDVHSNGMRRFITFMGKSGYRENFINSGLMDEGEMNESLHYDLPGGPSRALYLSALEPKDAPIGFVLANGEKITEWIHWLPFVRFARKEYDQGEPALKLYEICQDRPGTKEGILLSTSPPYSIFMPMDQGDMVVNVGRFADYENPSKIRSTLMVTSSDNRWATRVLNQYGHRSITFFSD